MNKISRILGSTVLSAGLTFGGLGLAGPAIAGGDHHDDHRKSTSHHRDHRGWDRDHDKCDHRHNGDHRNHHAGYHDGRYDKDCDHKHERVYYKDHRGNWKYVVIVVAIHR